MAGLVDRMFGAAKLDVHTYEEVEADTTATGQALGVVVVSSVAQGLGSLNVGGAQGLVAGTIGALIGWFVWAFIIFIIGTKLLPEAGTKSDVGELLRTTGFSASPGVLRVLGMIPILGLLIVLAANIWMLVAMIVAVRQALDYKSTGRAVGVCVLGFIAYVIVVGIIFALLGVQPSQG